MLYTSHYASPLGGMTLVSDGTALVGLYFDGQKYAAEGLDATHTQKNLPIFEEARRWLDVYFSGRKPDFTPPTAPAGTAFQQSVWEILRTIPYGETTTYGAIARRIEQNTGCRMSAQAGGRASGRRWRGIVPGRAGGRRGAGRSAPPKTLVLLRLPADAGRGRRARRRGGRGRPGRSMPPRVAML